MDAELKSKWVEALRSGKFKQGTGLLRERGSYCCLGVLCSVVELPIIENDRPEGGQESHSMTARYQPIAELIGIDPEGLYQFTYRNDGIDGLPQHSFALLADYIEANVPSDPLS